MLEINALGNMNGKVSGYWRTDTFATVILSLFSTMEKEKKGGARSDDMHIKMLISDERNKRMKRGEHLCADPEVAKNK